MVRIIQAQLTQDDLSELIKQKAFDLGFTACGIASATRLVSYDDRFSRWLEDGLHGSMAYMANNKEKRLDPRELLPGAKSVIVVALNYFPETVSQEPLRVSKYAYGKDYHYVIKEKLNLLIQYLHKLVPGTESRGFTDSAPVLERAWAVEAGLGWTGKNACLIIPKKGSFFFLAEIITSMELKPDMPFTRNHCGSCTNCMDACPTRAIISPGRIDARKCISYLTIEHKETIPHDIKKIGQGWIFGCDICQDVCPHNRFSTPANEPAFTPLNNMHQWPADQWRNLEKGDFKKIFIKGGSPISRIRYEKLQSNIPD
jgi:epoxyqueuosine reductase